MEHDERPCDSTTDVFFGIAMMLLIFMCLALTGQLIESGIEYFDGKTVHHLELPR